MPEDSSPTLRRPESLAPPRRRQPPPAIDPHAEAGPPSIGLDDLDRHNELDLGVGGSLELDLSPAPPPAEPPPGIDMPSESGLDFLAPVGLEPSESGLDLPSPVGVSGASVREESNAYALDLPAPVDARPAAPSFGRPAAPPLARPAAPPLARPAAPPLARPAAPPLARPAAPPGSSSVEPLSFDDDLPMPVELDLPTPVGAPAVDEGFDLPIPADLPMPGGGSQMVAPVGLDVAPAELGVAPAELDLEPKLAGNEVAPHDLPGLRGTRAPGADAPEAARPSLSSEAVAAATSGAGLRGPASSPTVGPAPAASRPAVSRGVLIVAGGLLALGLAGVGLLSSGLLDPPDPEPAALRGAGTKPSPDGRAKANANDEGTPPDGAVPSGTVAERAPAVLALLAAHTPEAYGKALAASREAGDAVGVAEAALLLAFHYGPNPARLDEAGAALQPHASSPAAHVRRVVGLAALLRDDHAAAEAALVGDEPRTRLYRGWLRLAQGRPSDARAEAEAVLGALPDEVAARHLALAVRAAEDPFAAVAELQAAVDQSPHPALRGLLAAIALRTGQLAIARAAVDALDPDATDEPGVQAWIHVRTARVQAAQGDELGALAALERALERVPEATAVQMERIRALLAAKRFNEASTAVSALVRERPQDQEAQLLQAEVAIQSGDGDIALQVLGTLEAARPEDYRVKLAKGEVHAMRLEVEEGRAAFAAAAALAPLEPRIAVSEAVLLADAKRLPDALQVLRTAREAAEAAGRAAHVARLWVAKAELHLGVGERNAALDALDRALEAVPHDNEAQLLRGVLRLKAGQEAAARSDLVAVFERTGGYPDLAAPLGRLYVRGGDYDALERLVADRLRGERTADELLALGARLRLHQGRTADARALLELALTRHPADWEAHMLLSQVLILEGDAAGALTEIDRSRPSTPQPERMLQRGKILEFNGRHGDAVPEYQRALSLDPELHEARFLYGRMLHYDGAHAKAIAELRKVLDQPRAEAAPWYPEVWLNIGVALAAQGKYEVAIESLGHATELDPELGEAWAKAGKLHADHNEPTEAITALEKAVGLGTKDDHWYADALMDLGRAQARTGKAAAARKSLEEFLKVASPESTSRPEAERLLAEL